MNDNPPISNSDVRELFEYFEHISTTGYECDHGYTQTERFLRSRNLSIQPMLTWLVENGAGCDCEVMFNTAPQWGDAVGYKPAEEYE
jgi:hypothetical protein